MTINIMAYPPGGGGNHLKNMIELDGRFCDQWPWPWVREQRVGLAPYDRPLGPPGEVHSLPGRNIHAVFVDHVSQHPHGDYLLHGHFGELAAHADQIRTWTDVRWLVQIMDDQQDRDLLRQRQHRLAYHPYWQDEEQIFMYRPEMYRRYFGADPARICVLPVRLLWQRDIVASGVLEILQTAFDTVIDQQAAQDLHSKWCDLNFGPTVV